MANFSTESLAHTLYTHPIYLLWFQTKPEEFGFQLRVGNWRFRQFTMGFITMTRFNSGFKLNPGLKPNLKPDQINWVIQKLIFQMTHMIICELLSVCSIKRAVCTLRIRTVHEEKNWQNQCFDTFFVK